MIIKEIAKEFNNIEIFTTFAQSMRQHTPNMPGWILKYDGTNESCLGAFEEEHLKAFILYKNIEKSCEIMYLATEPQSRGQGIMNELLSYLVRQMKSGFDEVWLEVSELNKAAIVLYQKKGFKVVGERPNYYKDGSKAVLMSLKLN